MCHHIICSLEMRNPAVREDEQWDEHVYTLQVHIVCQNVGVSGRKDLYRLSCRLIDLLVSSQNLEFSIEEGIQRSVRVIMS